VKGKLLYVLYPFGHFGNIKEKVSDDPLLNIGQIVFDFDLKM